jgi:hypothetical protein
MMAKRTPIDSATKDYEGGGQLSDQADAATWEANCEPTGKADSLGLIQLLPGGDCK